MLACRPTLEFEGERLPTISDFMNGDKKPVAGNTFTEKAGINISDSILKADHTKVYYKIRKALFAKKEFVKAVDDVSFEVYKGETLGLVGESGCGKTTLGRAILQLIPESAGKIIFQETDLKTLGKKRA